MYNYKYEKHLQNVERCRDGVPKTQKLGIGRQDMQDMQKLHK